jgi:hypothetical protein
MWHESLTVGWGGITQSTKLGTVVSRGEWGVTSVLEGDNGSQPIFTSISLEDFGGEVSNIDSP